MKRWLCLLALLMLLTGCGAETADPQGTQNSEALPSQQPTGMYDAEHELEADTAGAVKIYRLEGGDFSAMVPMGENYLIFGEKTLTVLTGEELLPAAAITVENLPAADSGMIRVSSEGVMYYDTAIRTIVYLDSSLQEIGRLSLSETVTGSVYLTPDTMYYCSGGCVRVLELQSGVSRLLKEQDGTLESITGGLFEGRILRCSLEMEDGTARTVLISGEDGQTLAQGGELANMQLADSWYFLIMDREWIVGNLWEQPHNFLYDETGQYIPLPEMGGIAQVEPRENGICLHYYNLSTGRRSGEVFLEGITEVTNLTTDGTDIWFCSEGFLCRWTPETCPADDQTVYTAPRYTREDPDEEGLASLELRAQALEQRYGVDILFWEEPEGFAPWDYSFETEFMTEPFTAALDALEKAMGQFPDGFFRRAADWTDSGVLKILLVKGIYGSPDPQTMNSAAGMQYLLNGDACIALALGDGLERGFYHTMGHLIDTVVLSDCTVFYEWEKLNPAGFQYDNDYIANQDRNDQKYLTGSNRYFIDTYAMSFAVEDRARILEYACMPGNEDYFTSNAMQAKLKRICEGIREAFGLKDDETRFVWEQYLK